MTNHLDLVGFTTKRNLKTGDQRMYTFGWQWLFGLISAAAWKVERFGEGEILINYMFAPDGTWVWQCTWNHPITTRPNEVDWVRMDQQCRDMLTDYLAAGSASRSIVWVKKEGYVPPSA